MVASDQILSKQRKKKKYKHSQENVKKGLFQMELFQMEMKWFQGWSLKYLKKVNWISEDCEGWVQ